jgi:hypothetical protein
MVWRSRKSSSVVGLLGNMIAADPRGCLRVLMDVTVADLAHRYIKKPRPCIPQLSKDDPEAFFPRHRFEERGNLEIG